MRAASQAASSLRRDDRRSFIGEVTPANEAAPLIFSLKAFPATD